MVALGLLTGMPASAEGVHLKQLLELASQNHPGVVAAQLQMQTARSLMLQADVSPNAVASAFSIPTQRNEPYFRQADKQIRLDQTLERGDKRNLRIQGARKLITASEQELAGIKRLSMIETAAAVVSLKLNESKLELLRQQAFDSDRLAQAAEFRVSKGDLAAVEAIRLRADAIRSQNEVRLAGLGLQKTRIELAGLLSLPAEKTASWTLLDSWNDLSPPVSETALQTLLQSDRVSGLGEVRAAKLRAEASEALLALAQAQRTRDVTVSAQAENQPGTGGAVVGLGVAIPLFNGNDFSGDIARATSQQSELQNEWQRKLLEVSNDLVTQTRELTAAQRRKEQIMNTLLPMSQKAADSLALAYKKGAASLTDFLDARRQANNAQLDAITVQAEYARAAQSLNITQQFTDLTDRPQGADAAGISDPTPPYFVSPK